MNMEKGVIDVIHLDIGEKSTLSHIVVNNCEGFKWIYKDSFATIKYSYDVEVELKIDKCNNDTREYYIVRGNVRCTRKSLWDDYNITTTKELEITDESAKLVFKRFKDYYTKLSSKVNKQ